MIRHRVKRFDVRHQPNGRLLLVDAIWKYAEILQHAFPGALSRHFPDRKDGYRWGMFFRRNADQSVEGRVARLLSVFQQVWLIDGVIDECYGLMLYTDPDSGERSWIGELIYEMKYHGLDTPDKIQLLAEPLSQFVGSHPTLARASILIPMPSSNPYQPNRLPVLLADEISRETGFPCASTQSRRIQRAP